LGRFAKLSWRESAQCGAAHDISRANWPIPVDGTSHVSKTPKTVAKTATKTVAKTPAKTNSATGKFYVGVGGWTFAPWRGVFYPEKLTQAKELEYAASRLTSIDITAPITKFVLLPGAT
jgi:hypothetical protein